MAAWSQHSADTTDNRTLIAVDRCGIVLSDKPQDGYDTETLANDLVVLMDALGDQRFGLYGTDTGMPIAYALAADHPKRVERLVVSEARHLTAASTAAPSALGIERTHLQQRHLREEGVEIRTR
jgi:pimeloyl-ACP methyl ester carboxylesterase